MTQAERQMRRRIKRKADVLMDQLVLVDKSGIWPNVEMDLTMRSIGLITFLQEEKRGKDAYLMDFARRLAEGKF